MITSNDLHVFFDELNKKIKDENFLSIREEIETFFNNIRILLKENEFENILNETKFNTNQKNILLDCYKNGKEILDFLTFKISDFNINNIEDINKTNYFLDVFEKNIFTKDFYKLINSTVDDLNLKENIFDSILFIRQNILPNVKAEVCARLYVYIISDNLRIDLLKDENFRNSIKTPEFKNNLVSKISSHMEFWKLVRNKANDVNCTIKREYPNYSHFGFNDASLDGGLNDISLKNTPPGFFDVVMTSPDGKSIFIARVNNNYAESDIYDHLNNRLIEESAITAMLQNIEGDIVLFDFCKGHSESLIKRFTGHNIETDDLLELKKIFDIILHKAVSEITGFDPIIIQLGDRKYNIEQEEFLDLSLNMTEFMKKDNLNFDNKFVMDILQKTTEWLTLNLMKNIDFYSDDNILKCKKYLLNIYEILNKNSIIKTNLDKEIDHLETKLDNLENSKIKLQIDLKRETILKRLSYLEENGLSTFLTNEDLNYFTKIRNIILDNMNNLVYVLSGDENDFYNDSPFALLPTIKNKRNAQYDIFGTILSIETMNKDQVCETLKNKIRINDPFLEILYETKNNLNSFQNNCSLDTARSLKENFQKIDDFLNEEGPIYKYFYNKNSSITVRSFNQAGDFFQTGCNFSLNVDLLNEFEEKMPLKIKTATFLYNDEIKTLNEQLNECLKLKEKLNKKELINKDEIPDVKRIKRIKPF